MQTQSTFNWQIDLRKMYPQIDLVPQKSILDSDKTGANEDLSLDIMLG